VITADGGFERAVIAEMTASGFRLTRVPPLIGRTLREDDERRGAPRVIVIGYDAWVTRFASDPAVIGTTVRLGAAVHTVVGVMPEGFAFPVNHRFWIPLQADPSDYERRQGPAIHVFGRLAPGVSREAAQAELTTIGLRAAAAFPATNERLQPRLAPYVSLWFGDDLVDWHLHVLQFFVTLLLIVVCVNVASLVYARTATRHGEIAVRSALGGSRHRIVAQLVVEALVLSTIAAAAGLLVADRALSFVTALMGQFGGAPFWVDDGLSTGAVLYVVGLVAVGAAIVGAVPALKATSRRLEPGLRQLSGGAGLRLGRTWTALIVAQVALAVAIMPAAFFQGWQTIQYRSFDPGFAADEFLTAQITMDRDVPPTAEAEAYRQQFALRFAGRLEDVIRQVKTQPGVAGVTFASRLPGTEPTTRIEVEGQESTRTTTPDRPAQAGSRSGNDVRIGSIAVDFFEVFEVPLLAGRRFGSGDFDAALPTPVNVRRQPTISGQISQTVGVSISGGGFAIPRSNTIVVNRSFAQQISGDGQVLGRRVRYAGASGNDARWFEIVGVVGDFPPNTSELTSSNARMYHPATAIQVYPASVAVRVRGTPATSLAGKLREITTAIDPTLQLSALLPLDQVYGEEQRFMRLGAVAFATVTLSVLLLSTAGLYALMSFTVAERRREIGIRAALGADPRRIVAGIFSRAFRQLARGVVVGLGMAAVLFEEMTDGKTAAAEGAILLPAVVVIMMAVGLLAAIAPARSGLRIDPSESLRTDG
jgi:putative ABC transport system permease protein